MHALSNNIITRLVFQGMSGSVYLARERKTKHVVALKVCMASDD